MSETWRERLSQRRLEIAIQGPEYYIQRYIESYCYEADRLCKKMNMKKTMDGAIDSMKDKKFDSFTKGVINSQKGGYDPHNDSKKRNCDSGFKMMSLKKIGMPETYKKDHG